MPVRLLYNYRTKKLKSQHFWIKVANFWKKPYTFSALLLLLLIFWLKYPGLPLCFLQHSCVDVNYNRIVRKIRLFGSIKFFHIFPLQLV